jgi:tRNA(Arg) A34 adenosine deaminase TadA
MATVHKYFRLARKIAATGDTKEATRQYKIGAVGIRADGAIVASSNIPHRTPEPRAHAETRLARKLDWGSVVYVVRILSDGQLANARPCKSCRAALRGRGVKRVYYSIGEKEYGVLEM